MGHWIILEGPGGRRKVEAGRAYRRLPGEQIVGTEQNGSVDHVSIDPAKKLISEIEGELATEGKGLGDWTKRLLKPVALMLGKKNCMSCEARKIVLNAVTKLTDKYGRAEAKRITKGLLIRSMTEKPEAILRSLREVL